MNVSLANAKRKLPELIKAVEQGEAVTSWCAGTPVVDLVPAKACESGRPKFGTLAGRIKIHDPDWWKST